MEHCGCHNIAKILLKLMFNTNQPIIEHGGGRGSYLIYLIALVKRLSTLNKHIQK